MDLHASPPRSGRRPRLAVVLILALTFIAGCGDSDTDSAEETDSGTETSTTASEASEPTDTTAADSTESDDPEATAGESDDATDTDPDDATVDPAQLEQLRAIIDETVARTSATFSLEVVQTLPVAGQNQAAMRRSGSFDDERLAGSGTLQFSGDGAAADSAASGDAFEQRIVDDTYWLLNPTSDPPSWIGYDLESAAELVEGDPTLAVDGDRYLLAVSDAATAVTDVVDFDDGSKGWTLRVAADELLPLVVTTGVQQRLTAAGLEPTGLESTVSLAVDPEGMVVGLIADLDDWWQATVEQTVGSGEAPAGMVVQLQIGNFDEPVDVESPCTDPEELLEPGAPPALTCEG